jgi:hypothetical protein
MNNTRLTATSQKFNRYDPQDEDYYQGSRVFRGLNEEELLSRSRKPTAQVQAIVDKLTMDLQRVPVTGSEKLLCPRASGTGGRSAARDVLSPSLREAQGEVHALGNFKAHASSLDWSFLDDEGKESPDDLDASKLAVKKLEDENERLRDEMMKLKGAMGEAVDNLKESVGKLADAGRTKGLSAGSVLQGTKILLDQLDMAARICGAAASDQQV